MSSSFQRAEQRWGARPKRGFPTPAPINLQRCCSEKARTCLRQCSVSLAARSSALLPHCTLWIQKSTEKFVSCIVSPTSIAGSFSRIRADSPIYNSLSRLAWIGLRWWYLEIWTCPTLDCVGWHRSPALMTHRRGKCSYCLNRSSIWHARRHRRKKCVISWWRVKMLSIWWWCKIKWKGETQNPNHQRVIAGKSSLTTEIPCRSTYFRTPCDEVSFWSAKR